MSTTRIPFVQKGKLLMTDIVMKPSPEFGLSPSDRQHLGGPWFHSFIGSIKFIGKHKIIEETSVPIIFIAFSIIEASFLIRDFGFNVKTIPIPSTDREIEIRSKEEVFLSSVNLGNTVIPLDIPLNNRTLNLMFINATELLRQWNPTYKDDKHFVSSNWLFKAAMERLYEAP